MFTLAGAVIVSEAGGVVLDPSGKEFDIMSRRILVASTQKLVDEWKNQVDYQIQEFERDFPEICPMWKKFFWSFWSSLKRNNTKTDLVLWFVSWKNCLFENSFQMNHLDLILRLWLFGDPEVGSKIAKATESVFSRTPIIKLSPPELKKNKGYEISGR